MFIILFFIFALVYLVLLKPNQINSILLFNEGELTKIVIGQTKVIVPKTIFKKSENCWIFDFNKTSINNSLLKKTYAKNLVKMCFVSCPDKKSNHARLRIYVCENSTLKVSKSDNSLTVSIGKRGKDAEPQQEGNNFGLVNHSDRQLAPVLIDVKGKSLYPILDKLAENIGVKLKFKNEMPENVSIKLEASDSTEALYGIASLLGISIEKNGKTWALMRHSKIYK